jgi:hypothetical protein
MIAKFTFNYNGAFEKKENAVFQQGSLGVDSYQVYAPFPTTTQVFHLNKEKRRFRVFFVEATRL